MPNKIYSLMAEPEKYLWLTLSDENKSESLEPIREAQPLKEKWEPVEVKPIFDSKEDREKELSDFPEFWSLPTISEKAVKILGGFLTEGVELLPVSGYNYFIINITRVIQALDERNSAIERFSSGKIMKVENYWFFDNKLENTPIFKLSGYHRVKVFVNESFYNTVKNSELTGFRFQQVWPHVH